MNQETKDWLMRKEVPNWAIYVLSVILIFVGMFLGALNILSKFGY